MELECKRVIPIGIYYLHTDPWLLHIYKHELWIKDIGQLGVPSTTEAKGLQQQIANYSVYPVMQAII